MAESRYTRTGRADLIARLEAIDLAIARIQDRLGMCRRNQEALRDVIDKAKALARVQTYEIALAELGVDDAARPVSAPPKREPGTHIGDTPLARRNTRRRSAGT